MLRECRAFTRLLVDGDPTPYMESRYLDAQVSLGNPERASATDRLLVEFAAGGPVAARIADAYSRLFYPAGLLRRKLILMFAILENTREYQERFLAGGDGQRFKAWLRIGAAVASSCLLMAAGVLLLGPRDLLCRNAAALR